MFPIIYLILVHALIALTNGQSAHVDVTEMQGINIQNTNSKISMDDHDDDNMIWIPNNTYKKIVHYSKVCGLTSCMRLNGIVQGKRLDKGGCPRHLRFCHDEDINPTASDTTIALVLEADKGELGSGFIMVDHKNRVITVVFRSSTTIQDWISDFTILPIDYSPVCSKEYKRSIEKGIIKECRNCKMHRGFHVFTKTLSRHFLRKIEGILESYPDFHVVATGHSLGAALAIMTGIELKLRGYDPLVLTYASPKIFNTEMQEWVNELFDTEEIHERIMEKGKLNLKHGYFRVIHNDDYIPLLPPFYHTAGIEIVIEKRNLPHEPQDLDYRGPSEKANLMTSSMLGEDYVDQLLHTYEHRSYFIDMGSCANY
ncbi:similar to Saccharomyces cerevisiae YJR107W Putative protein of unknown function [Maudiozyma barnettii]|uniref:triacylglycerol lipase n=1 Tax=Maudiozyma barnettii TaxID=61262 RepID=A0A8H2VH82_9SACH|nr:putative lipase [Kazachstania barnettii]CAB4255619.1 similar to Saccharomyces cerevisiae YJR107W Putative protein of unknown function [Kazachstania barnettii]CAD1784180.1 similar to Saccharomyces cerevisiae YJR107W Putative protein of unknown function [Kazachstania barnettii]